MQKIDLMIKFGNAVLRHFELKKMISGISHVELQKILFATTSIISREEALGGLHEDLENGFTIFREFAKNGDYKAGIEILAGWRQSIEDVLNPYSTTIN